MVALCFDATNIQPRETIGELKSLADIHDIASSYTKLKKRKHGVYWGCCPLHAENTPSFKVEQQRQQFHCFGCSAHGDVIDLIAGVERLDRSDAIWRLRELVGRDHTSSRPSIKPRPAMPAAPPAPTVRFQDAAAFI